MSNTFYLLSSEDPFHILRQGEFGSHDEAVAEMMPTLSDQLPPLVVEDYEGMINMRGRGAMSWVKEDTGGI